MLVSIPPKMSISSFMGYLKGKSSLIIFERHANLKYKYGNRVFWAKGYFVSTVGKNKKKIEEYIRNQIKEDMINDQMTIKEYIDPFKGEQVKKIAVVGSKIPLKRLLALVPYRAQRKTTCYTRGFLFAFYLFLCYNIYVNNSLTILNLGGKVDEQNCKF